MVDDSGLATSQQSGRYLLISRAPAIVKQMCCPYVLIIRAQADPADSASPSTVVARLPMCSPSCPTGVCASGPAACHACSNTAVLKLLSVHPLYRDAPTEAMRRIIAQVGRAVHIAVAEHRSTSAWSCRARHGWTAA